jgi:hypothetical protein
MILDVLVLSALVALGLLIAFCKMSWTARLWLLSHPMTVDALTFAALTAIHWGTFTGVMVGGTAALLCQIMLSIGRSMFGHVDKARHYHKGLFDMWHHIAPPAPQMPITDKRNFL